KRLRQRLSKLKSSVSIQTVRGQGYRVDQNV
ncbi:helix-turn-helix domain-containing protein, partial [Staphylococcus epidermidis]